MKFKPLTTPERVFMKLLAPVPILFAGFYLFWVAISGFVYAGNVALLYFGALVVLGMVLGALCLVWRIRPRDD